MNAHTSILKYPRTQHIESSRLQKGDENLDEVPFTSLRGKNLVVEEKMDGANSGISFDSEGNLLLQSRGHYLSEGQAHRERHFAPFKRWANLHMNALFEILEDRYVMYGEWLYAKHTVFYDALPHYFMEFDLYDRETETFLDTPRRKALLEGSPVHSVLVLKEGQFRHLKEITSLVGPSHFKTEQCQHSLEEAIERHGQYADMVLEQTDLSLEMEGLYIKWEEDGIVKGRYKFVRDSFQNALLNSGSHWHSRPILPNQLTPKAKDLLWRAS